jgi:predicted nucleotidyltransferase
VVSTERRQEVDAFVGHLENWAAARADVVAAAIVGSWARGQERKDSDLDVVLLVAYPSAYLEADDWIAQLAPTAQLLRNAPLSR